MRKYLGRLPRTAVILALLTLLMYLPGFWWGAPAATAPGRDHAWGVDDETPLGPLAEMHGIIEPKADRNLGYPLLFSFIVAAAYAPYLGYLWLTGALTTISAIYPFGLTDPAGSLKVLTSIAHMVSVLMGMGTIIATYDTARTLWGERTALFAALFAMVMYPMFYYARTGNVDMTMMFFIALSLAAFARSLQQGYSTRRAAWLGIFMGLALATKEQALAVFLTFPVILLPAHWRQLKATSSGLSSWAFWKAPFTAAITTFLAFGLGSGLFVAPERFFAHLEFAAQRRQEVVDGRLVFTQALPYTLAGHLELVRQIAKRFSDSLTLPGLFLAIIGMVWAIKRDRRTSTLILPMFTYVTILFVTAHLVKMRYLLPASLILALFAARAIIYALDSRHVVLRVGLPALAIIAIGLNILRGADLTYAMINDSRYEAAAWLEPRTEAGDTIEYFGYTDPLPPLESGVVTTPTIRYLGGLVPLETYALPQSEITEQWARRQPKYVIVVPDHTSQSGIPHSIVLSPDLFQELLDGRLGYRQEAFFQTPALLPWVKRPTLDYPTVNPPVRIFASAMRSASEAASQ